MPDCVVIYDIASARSTLFIPPLRPSDVIWSGLPLGADEALGLFDIDDVKTTDELNAHLSSPAVADKSTVYALAHNVSDHVTFLPFDTVDFDQLMPAIEETRVVKDDFEVGLIRDANAITAEAHRAVLERVRTARNERELEAVFVERCMARGARNMAYHPIVASGRAGATLHYVSNYADLHGKNNILLDAGGELRCYASDVVRRTVHKQW